MGTVLDGAISVRDATPGDAEAMAHVEVRAWQATYEGILPAARLAAMSEARAQARWMRVLAMPGRSAIRAELVGLVDDELVAFASGGTLDGSTARMARLDMLYVLPAFQRRGLGRALTREFAQRMSHAGLTALWVDVLAKNARARRFYRALGGIELARTWGFWGTTPLVTVSYGWSLPEGLARIG